MASSRATPSDAHRPYRLPRIIALLREQPLPAEVLRPRLNALLYADMLPGISLRALQRDLEWLLRHLGAGGIERVAKSDLKPAPPPEFHRSRQFYRLIGAEDLIPTTGELVFITGASASLDSAAIRMRFSRNSRNFSGLAAPMIFMPASPAASLRSAQELHGCAAGSPWGCRP